MRLLGKSLESKEKLYRVCYKYWENNKLVDYEEVGVIATSEKDAANKVRDEEPRSIEIQYVFEELNFLRKKSR